MASGTGPLAGHVAVVTGGSRGIGRAIAARLLSDGAAVAITGRDAALGQASAEELGRMGKAIYVQSDVTDRASLERLTATVRQELGVIDILVSNAALYADLVRRPFWEIPEAEFDEVMKVNVRGTIGVATAVLPHMRERGQGRIVILSSVVGLRGTPFLMHYIASKGALNAMTKSMARELGPFNIAVNAVAPGMTDTEGSRVSATREYMQQLADERAFPRIEVPEDVVGAVAFFCSPDSAFVTGQLLVVDGGGVMH